MIVPPFPMSTGSLQRGVNAGWDEATVGLEVGVTPGVGVRAVSLPVHAHPISTALMAIAIVASLRPGKSLTHTNLSWTITRPRPNGYGRTSGPEQDLRPNPGGLAEVVRALGDHAVIGTRIRGRVARSTRRFVSRWPLRSFSRRPTEPGDIAVNGTMVAGRVARSTRRFVSRMLLPSFSRRPTELGDLAVIGTMVAGRVARSTRRFVSRWPLPSFSRRPTEPGDIAVIGTMVAGRVA